MGRIGLRLGVRGINRRSFIDRRGRIRWVIGGRIGDGGVRRRIRRGIGRGIGRRVGGRVSLRIRRRISGRIGRRVGGVGIRRSVGMSRITVKRILRNSRDCPQDAHEKMDGEEI